MGQGWASREPYRFLYNLGLSRDRFGEIRAFPMKAAKSNDERVNYEGPDLVRPTDYYFRRCEWCHSMRNEAVVQNIPVRFLVNWFLSSFQRKRSKRAF